MNENNMEVVKFIESIGFILDIEDMIWYTKNYEQRIVVQKYCKQPYSIFYSNGFNNGKPFTTVLDLKTLLKINNLKR